MSATTTSTAATIAIAGTFCSVSYASRFYGRAECTIRYWCTHGVFGTLNIPCFKDRRGRWWILIPADN